MTLNYTTGNGTWTNIAMSNLGGSVWNAYIPAFPYGTKVTWIIRAQDNADNAITTLGLGYEYQYQVIPEFPITGIALLLFMVSTLLAAAFHRRKRFNNKQLTRA